MAVDKAPVTSLLAENLTAYRSHATSIGLPCCLPEVLEADWMNLVSATETIRAALKGRYPELLICSDCLYQSASVVPLVDLINAVSIYSPGKNYINESFFRFVDRIQF